MLRSLFGTIVFAAVYYAIFAYPPLRFISAWLPQWAPGTATLLLVVVGPSVAWLTYRRWRNAFTRTLVRLAYIWLGLCFLSLLVMLPWEVLVRLGDIQKPYSAWLLTAALAALWLVGSVSAMCISVKEITVQSEKLAHPVKLVQLSDVHVGSRLPAYLTRVSARVSAIAPDVVVITGDLIDFEGVTSADLASLASINAPVYFCIGNHERYVDCDAICERLRGHGVKVLRNAHTMGNNIRFIGVDDAEKTDQVATHLTQMGLPSGPFTVLLYHRPDGFEDAAAAGVDLMLCGHTHNGQIAPFNALVRTRFPRIAGRYEHEQATLYVSPGTGTWGPPFRLGSTNEITVINLAPGAG